MSDAKYNLPWKHIKTTDCIKDSKGTIIADGFMYGDFICFACNNYDELVEALKAWQLYDSESVQYRDKAKKLTETILKKIGEE